MVTVDMALGLVLRTKSIPYQVIPNLLNPGQASNPSNGSVIGPNLYHVTISEAFCCTFCPYNACFFELSRNNSRVAHYASFLSHYRFGSLHSGKVIDVGQFANEDISCPEAGQG